jgi:hypothetical protein
VASGKGKMFGFFKFKRSVGHARKYVLTMIAPAQVHGTLPNAVFGDAYVIGFLQILVMHAANESQGKALKPEDQMLIFEAVMNGLVPGLGRQINPMLEQVNYSNHPAHVNYSVGRREGHEYVTSLVNGDDSRAQSLSFEFIQFIKRNHLGLSN